MTRRTMLTPLVFAACIAGGAAAANPQRLPQGPSWGETTAQEFYTTSQGSRLIPLAWIQALRASDGKGFMADGLTRYGYLANTTSASPLPVGFVADSTVNGPVLGMTCAACHTREISAGGVTYRIDGGPALADASRFLLDLDDAVGRVTSTDDSFKAFAADVLGSDAPDSKVAQLRADVTAWYQANHLIMDGVRAAPAWGAGRMDAINMIFNRVTGLDIGQPEQNYLIAPNIRPTVAPTRYPFLWNAAVQDRTQWPGFAANGNSLLGLARNTGEVMGVFARFHPKPSGGFVIGMDFLANGASMDFGGLWQLEDYIRRIGPPSWPQALKVDQALASAGREIYAGKGGCANCHWLSPIPQGVMRAVGQTTWCTPIVNVHTDMTELKILQSTVQTGVLSGYGIPFVTDRLQPVDQAFNVLGLSVSGSILDHLFPPARMMLVPTEALAIQGQAPAQSGLLGATSALDQARKDLRSAFQRVPGSGSLTATTQKPIDQCGKDPTEAGYESRVLYGIWAAAPYLHNGSVPTLADLLKPAKDRPATFDVGTDYDMDNIGLAAHQSAPRSSFTATNCAAQQGNGTCGHEYGTDLSADEKKALLEFLKTL